jgi:diguanylate cyclase (GGDEF)-like protein
MNWRRSARLLSGLFGVRELKKVDEQDFSSASTVPGAMPQCSAGASNHVPEGSISSLSSASGRRKTAEDIENNLTLHINSITDAVDRVFAKHQYYPPQRHENNAALQPTTLELSSPSLPPAVSNKDAACPFCNSLTVFDNWRDINLCPKCGAQETTRGWQNGVFPILLLNGFKYGLGPEVGFPSFYLIPVALVSWFVSLRAGVITAVASALSLLSFNLLYQPSGGSLTVSYWNATGNLGVFLVMVCMVRKGRELYFHEEGRSREDFLTGGLNRRAFTEILTAESKRSCRHGRPLTIVYIDLDNFKFVNDHDGYESGDSLLRELVLTIRSTLRAEDSVARLGGDEFALLLPESDEKNALVIVDKVKDALQKAMALKKWPVTFSIGAVTFHSPPESADLMIYEAGKLMQSVKKSGKNRVVGLVSDRREIASQREPCIHLLIRRSRELCGTKFSRRL